MKGEGPFTVFAPTNAALAVNQDGTITVTPNRGFRGVTNFTYSVKDNEGAESAATNVTIKTPDCIETSNVAEPFR